MNYVAIQVHAQLHIHTYTHTRTHTHMCTHTHTHTHTYTHIHTHTHTHSCTHHVCAFYRQDTGLPIRSTAERFNKMLHTLAKYNNTIVIIYVLSNYSMHHVAMVRY